MKDHTRKYIHKNAENTRKTNIPRRGINDYQSYIGTNKQGSEYKTAAEFIINCIKQTLTEVMTL